MKIGDKIFYRKDGKFYVDEIANIEIIDGKSIYEPNYRNWWSVTEDELLDESDEEVRNYMALVKDDMVKLNGKMVQVQDKDLPPGVTLPYRIKPGNIAVSKNYIFLFF